MCAATSNRRRTSQRAAKVTVTELPPIICSHCGGPIKRGQQIGPLFSPRLVTWSAHPVLSKPPMIRGLIPVDGSPGRSDLSLAEQLRQRAAMGGDKERAELAAFEKLMAECVADALVAQIRKEAADAGLDVWTYLARQTQTDTQ